MNRLDAWTLRHKIERAAALLDDETALDSVEMFPRWTSGIAVAVGQRFSHEGVLYACVQAHTTQDGWEPSLTPALWKVVSVEEFPEWVQPTGAQDAYNTGDKVTYKGEHYESTMDGNIWSPEAYPAGWNKLS